MDKASVCGRRAGKVERRRSATPAAEPQTEVRRSCGHQLMQARDERALQEGGAGGVR